MLNNVKMAPTDLSIGDANESLVDQFVPQWVPGLALHDVALCCFIGKRDGWYLTEERETQRRCCNGGFTYLQHAFYSVKAFIYGYNLLWFNSTCCTFQTLEDLD